MQKMKDQKIPSPWMGEGRGEGAYKKTTPSPLSPAARGGGIYFALFMNRSGVPKFDSSPVFFRSKMLLHRLGFRLANRPKIIENVVATLPS